MKITFPDSHEVDQDTFGISFPADVDGENIICLVSTDALQQINQANEMDTPENQFNDNKSRFRLVAEQKIRNGEVVNGKVIIREEDVR